MRLDEMARDAAEALEISVAGLEPPPIDEKPRLGRVGVAALARVAVVLLVVGAGIGWWMTRDTSDQVSVGSGADVEVPRLGLVDARWKVTAALEFPVPESLASRLAPSLEQVNEGYVLVYEDRQGTGAFVTLTVEAGNLDDERRTQQQSGVEPAAVTVGGNPGFEAHTSEGSRDDVGMVGWAPGPGVVATLTVNGAVSDSIDLVELAETATTLDDSMWLAVQEFSGWAQVLRSATADYDEDPPQVGPDQLREVLPAPTLVGILLGDTAVEAAESPPVLAEILRDPPGPVALEYRSGSTVVHIAVGLDPSGQAVGVDETAASDSLEPGAASVLASRDELVVWVTIVGWPDDSAQQAAEALTAVVFDAAAHPEG